VIGRVTLAGECWGPSPVPNRVGDGFSAISPELVAETLVCETGAAGASPPAFGPKWKSVDEINADAGDWNLVTNRADVMAEFPGVQRDHHVHRPVLPGRAGRRCCVSPTRRDLFNRAGGVAGLLALPQACRPIEQVVAAPISPPVEVVDDV